MHVFGVYLAAWFLYLMVAMGVWIACCILALHSRTRPLAVRLAVGMAGSFPGVFLAQMVTGPPIIVMVILGMVMGGLLKDDGGVAIGCALIGMVVFASASLVGFCTGWALAWRVASGRSLWDAVVLDSWFGAGLQWLLQLSGVAVKKAARMLR
ncbi:MAG: hypothetical protein J0L84_05330 [Verrucomicrobia bacterium]|nr:hypothetical protein [Verrucomicrobiota bacterium]